MPLQSIFYSAQVVPDPLGIPANGHLYVRELNNV